MTAERWQPRQVIDPNTGELAPCTGCITERRRADAIEQDLDNSELAVRKERRVSQALRAELSKAREDEPKAAEIREVLEDWRKQTGHPRADISLDGDRAKCVRALLNKPDWSVDR